MNNYAIIVAGGSGTRMASAIPKQFLLLNHRPILMRSIEAFHKFDSKIKIIVVLPKAYIEHWENLCIVHSFAIQHRSIAGGITRFHSVLNGLNFILDGIDSESLVAIHDAVRPLVSMQTLNNCFTTSQEKNTAVPCTSVNDSIRFIENETSKFVNRNNYKAIQTPQVFKLKVLKKAYLQKYSEEFTDDASVVESAGFPINLVEGNIENIKITTPLDIKIAESILAQFPK